MKNVIWASVWKHSRNSIEKIQPRMILAMFNGYPSTRVISSYSPTSISEETDLIAFYNEQSSLVHGIPKQNVRIIGIVMNALVGKNVKN